MTAIRVVVVILRITTWPVSLEGRPIGLGPVVTSIRRVIFVGISSVGVGLIR